MSGSWLPHLMYTQPQGTTGMAQGYSGTNGYYLPQHYTQQTETSYDGYGMIPGGYPYHQLPGVYGTPTQTAMTQSGYGSASFLDTPSSGGNSSKTSSSSTSPLSTSAEPGKKLTGAITTSGGRVRKKPLESGKPPYSYISMICMAIANSPDSKATLREICDYISERFPYYKTKTNWHGNIRHNLTLNDCFVKMPRRAGDKGHPWAIDPTFEDMFDGGSLLRRRYRFKEGSTKWQKSQSKAATAVPKKRGRKPKSSTPGNALVIPQPNGTSKLVPLSNQATTSTGSTSEYQTSPATDMHQQEQSLFEPSFGLSSPPPACVAVKQDNSSDDSSSSDTNINHNNNNSNLSRGSPVLHVISPMNGMAPYKNEGLEYSPPVSRLQDSTSPSSNFSTNKAESSAASSHLSQEQMLPKIDQNAQLSTSSNIGLLDQSLLQSSPLSRNYYSSPEGDLVRQHRSHDLLSPLSDGASPQAAEQQQGLGDSGCYPHYYNYMGYTSCHPVASSTPTPACSYPVPLGNSYLPSPCTTGSQLYQGLQSDYYNLLSSPKLQ